MSAAFVHRVYTLDLRKKVNPHYIVTLVLMMSVCFTVYFNIGC